MSKSLGPTSGGASKFVLNNDMDPFQALTGKKRSYMAETEHERTACGVDAQKQQQSLGHKELDQFHSNMNECLMEDVMNMAIRDKFKEEQKRAKQAEEDGEDGGDGGHTGEKDEHEDDNDGNVDDDDLEKIRARRMEKMRELQKKKADYKAQGHGEYIEIKEEEFLTTVTKSHRSIVHFYHKTFESCKVVDMHLKKMAKRFFGTKFVYLEAEKAPFFVQKLAVQTIPTICMFIDGVLVFKQLGFHGLEGGEKNEIQTGHLARVFRKHGLIEEEFDSEDESL